MIYLLTTLINNLDYSFYKSISIFLVSFFSNTFSAISGGGAGLIQLPALIFFGVPYSQALATHKLATVALGLGGSLRNYKSLKNDVYVAWQILIFGLPGVILGASVVDFISEEYLYLLLGIISVLLALYSFIKSDLGILSQNIQLNLIHKIRFIIFIFLIGILNGSISSGTGLLVTILLIKNLGMDFMRAVSLTFLTVGIFWNLIGAIFLSRVGSVSPNILFLLIVGSFLGGFLGAHFGDCGSLLGSLWETILVTFWALVF